MLKAPKQKLLCQLYFGFAIGILLLVFWFCNLLNKHITLYVFAFIFIFFNYKDENKD